MDESDALLYLNTDAYYDRKSNFSKLLDIINFKKEQKAYMSYRTGIDYDKVESSWYVGLMFKLLLKKLSAKKKYVSLLFAYRLLNKKAIRLLSQHKAINAFYGYDSGCIETLQWINNNRTKNVYVVLEQCIVPRRAQIETFEYLKKEFGIHIDHILPTLKILKEREESEWALANKILAPSLYVYDELIRAGADKEKLTIVPYGYQNKVEFAVREANLTSKFETEKPLKIIFVGNAGFRKGIHDFINVAKACSEENCEFFVIGNIETDAIDWLNANKSDNITFLGKLNKEKLNIEYKTADVFFFPSYLEGLAMVGLEALSWGLPTLTTNESGSVIKSGQEGYIYKAGEVAEMTTGLKNMIADKDLRRTMAFNALKRSEEFTHGEYEKKLVKELL
ncbi:glycosyltransferase family 4 protein [Winogradskyella psychrotolerans]|nr:glycosyltransferase family 4 protein [Winogradskyella psychrotolerans]